MVKKGDLNKKKNEAGAFSLVYSKEHQDKFLIALMRGDFEIALSALEQMPLTENSAGRLERLIVLVEGYKMISSIFYNNYKKNEIEEEFIKLKKKLFYYENLGSPDELIRRLHLLEQYIEIGSPEQIIWKLADYDNLRDRLEI